MNLSTPLNQAVDLVSRAHHLVAMTGAGLSTPSGIPDFRSAESGLWEQNDPLSVASIFAFRRAPQRFYHWIHPLARSIIEAHPNPAHYALAALEQQGQLKAIITQNIDDLHRKAGSHIVYELHGHLREVTCLDCLRLEDSTPYFRRFVETGDLPRCECGGVFKPSAILFGEQLPIDTLLAAELTIRQADLVLVAGSSLEVAPASDLPHLALENGARLVIVNQQPTYLDSLADVVIRGDVAEILPQLADRVIN
ncbi:MAG TPA: NAD-dependent deacylase [Anaerolineae bacterium]|nr:NAD-dependent deacylase [Anaerolineae bacterium]HMR67462.1 NAD-dependent deacylase [Anaerolineae bacterium]